MSSSDQDIHLPLDCEPLPQFHSIQLFKTEILGSGSYGVVCKATCDQRPCAAKLLHPIFFQSSIPALVTTRTRFEQECDFLREIKHPNIVQFLGTTRDPDSGLLVILMELMDESLTRFLELSLRTLLYHTEVNLCHDIAQAISYIHSNDIIHRDLSSNNVLLTADCKAKIADFGMSRLLGVHIPTTPLTMCPGTLVYMPPEALRDPPRYSTKLDCFSFGVLQVQIMTRQFPDPGPAMQVVTDHKSPIGRIYIPVPDSERRKSHIDLIDPTHSLLPIALNCLSYAEHDRPSANDICIRIIAIKESLRYIQSVQLEAARSVIADAEVKERKIEQLIEENKLQAQQILDLKQQLLDKDHQQLLQGRQGM